MALGTAFILVCGLGRPVASSNHQELLKDGTWEVEGSVQLEAWEFGKETSKGREESLVSQKEELQVEGMEDQKIRCVV